MSLINLIFASVFMTNVVTHSFLGIEKILAADYKKIFNNGLVLIVITLVISIIKYTFNDLLIEYNITFLNTFILIFIVVILSKLFSMIDSKVDFDYLITNTMVLGVALLSLEQTNLINTIGYSLGSSVGFLAITYLVMIINERLLVSKIKEPFKGIPITLITLSILYLIFINLGLK